MSSPTLMCYYLSVFVCYSQKQPFKKPWSHKMKQDQFLFYSGGWNYWFCQRSVLAFETKHHSLLNHQTPKMWNFTSENKRPARLQQLWQVHSVALLCLLHWSGGFVCHCDCNSAQKDVWFIWSWFQTCSNTSLSILFWCDAAGELDHHTFHLCWKYRVINIAPLMPHTLRAILLH